MAYKPFITSFGMGTNTAQIATPDPLKHGGKGYGLLKLDALALPVPSGFIIHTDICKFYQDNEGCFPDGALNTIYDNIKIIEQKTNKVFGGVTNPLIVSVRSGAPVSMPGMMDTALNVGLNDETAAFFAKTVSEEFAYSSYYKFLHFFATNVANVHLPSNPSENYSYKEQCEYIKTRIFHFTGEEFPQDVKVQLVKSMVAVLDSWMSRRAILYRNLHDIDDSLGTAIIIQSMVFGNIDTLSGTGVMFTRNPSDGKKGIIGEYLPQAQGEDVVSGKKNPLPFKAEGDNPSFITYQKEIYHSLEKLAAHLEHNFLKVQEVEFTIEQGTLWILQTRNAKLSAKASVKINVDMVQEKLISLETALLRVEPFQLEEMLHTTLVDDQTLDVITRGIPAAPGAVVGRIAFDSQTAEIMRNTGHKVILVRKETSPSDIAGMYAASGILTAKGGMTSHAAVVARGMGRPCITGTHQLQIDYDKKCFVVDGEVFNEGDTITIDGISGLVIRGAAPLKMPGLSGDFARLLEWADEVRHLNIRANGETTEDMHIAHIFGADGIGLCRTEQMFYKENRLHLVRLMILAENFQERKKVLEDLKELQKQDFIRIFSDMQGKPVAVRFFDPPLHEFLPHTEENIQKLATELNFPLKQLQNRINSLQEVNPILGHRGCRLAMSHPEIYEMQAEALFEALCHAVKKGFKMVQLELLIPFVSFVSEVKWLKEKINACADTVRKQEAMNFTYKLGVIIELPRAAIRADDIARHVDFISFGTNDLTQTTLGISRDDASPFLADYQRKKIIQFDPFVTLDIQGVGRLVEIATFMAKSVKPEIEMSLCGEHGGDPKTISFCQRLGIDYVSCSPYRVPVARLAAAQAVLWQKQNETQEVKTKNIKLSIE